MNANAYAEDQMIQAGTADCFEQHLDKRKNVALIDQRRGKARMRGKGEGKEGSVLGGD